MFEVREPSPKRVEKGKKHKEKKADKKADKANKDEKKRNKEKARPKRTPNLCFFHPSTKAVELHGFVSSVPSVLGQDKASRHPEAKDEKVAPSKRRSCATWIKGSKVSQKAKQNACHQRMYAN